MTNTIDLNTNPEYTAFKESLARLVSTLNDPQYKEFELAANTLTDDKLFYYFYQKVSQKVLKAITIDPYEHAVLLYDLDFFMMYLREKFEANESLPDIE